MALRQLKLILEKRFAPLFITQFLGALNDNIFRNALVILVAFTYAKQNEFHANIMVNVCAGLFILPYFIFSATAGQLADKFQKSVLIRYVKFFEVLIMSCVALGFYYNSLNFLIFILFLMGTQSTFFGPVKYSILPEYLEPNELLGGNAFVEMGTFMAILFGTIIGGLLMAHTLGPKLLSIVTISIAIFGFLSSLFIPKPHKSHITPDLKIDLNPFKPTFETIKFAFENRILLLSMLGISWFWFYGSIFVTQLPNYSIHFIGGTEIVVTILLTAYSIGIGVGSLLCDKLSGHKLEIGVIPLGALGLTIFSIDLSFAHPTTPLTNVGFVEFFSHFDHWRVFLDLFAMALSCGVYLVPLYTLLQRRSPAKIRSRVVAANNIVNAVAMVLSSVFAIAMFSIGMTIPQLFCLLGVLNFFVSIYIFHQSPEFVVRFVCWVVVHSFYRCTVKKMEDIPEKGPAIIACNHVSFLDPLVIWAASPRPIRFVMDHHIFQKPLINYLFRLANVIPIASHKEDPHLKEQAFQEVDRALKNGEIVGIFPEGGITNNGEIKDFRPGISRIIAATPCLIIPCAISGLWGSFFSKHAGGVMRGLPTTLFLRKLRIQFGPAITPEGFELNQLEEQVRDLRGNWL